MYLLLKEFWEISDNLVDEHVLACEGFLLCHNLPRCFKLLWLLWKYDDDFNDVNDVNDVLDKCVKNDNLDNIDNTCKSVTRLKNEIVSSKIRKIS